MLGRLLAFRDQRASVAGLPLRLPVGPFWGPCLLTSVSLRG